MVNLKNRRWVLEIFGRHKLYKQKSPAESLQQGFLFNGLICGAISFDHVFIPFNAQTGCIGHDDVAFLKF